MYWVVYSIQLNAEAYFGFLVNFLPFFSLVRLLFVLWLVLPQTQGASQIYVNHVQPFLSQHETQINESVWKLHSQLKAFGLEHLQQVLHYVKEYGFHYLMKTEVRPYRSAEVDPQPSSHEDVAQTSSVEPTSYLDNFFSLLKQPPTLVGQPASNSHNAPQQQGGNLGAQQSQPNTSALIGSALKFGMAAIQSSSKGSNTGSRNITPIAGHEQILGNSFGNDAGSSTGASFASETAYNRNVSGPSQIGVESKSSSNNSLTSDADFDFVKKEASQNYGDAASMATQTSTPPNDRRRSSGWFQWKKNSSSTENITPTEFDKHD